MRSTSLARPWMMTISISLYMATRRPRTHITRAWLKKTNGEGRYYSMFGFCALLASVSFTATKRMRVSLRTTPQPPPPGIHSETRPTKKEGSLSIVKTERPYHPPLKDKTRTCDIRDGSIAHHSEGPDEHTPSTVHCNPNR